MEKSPKIKHLKFNTGSIKFLFSSLLILLFLNNLNFFLKADSTKLFYFPIIIIMLVTAVWGAPFLLSVKKTWKVGLLAIIFYVILIYTPFTPFYVNHLFYVLVLLVLISTTYYSIIAFGLNLNQKFIRKTCYFIVFVSVIFSLIDVWMNRFPAGWTWFINIALQEIVLLSIIASLLIVRNNKTVYLLIILFLLLTYFRSSGKAALLVCILLLIFNQAKSIEGRYLFPLVILFHLFLFSIFIILGTRGFYDNPLLISQVDSLFEQRVVLLIDAYKQISNMSIPELFLGFGYDISNYLYEHDLTYANAPQLLPVTIFVYGGIFGLVFVYGSLLYLWKKIYNLDPDFGYKRSINAIFAIVFLILTVHEYFNNPFVYLAIIISASFSLSYYKNSESKSLHV